jgi:gamma-glutamyltranspeptidase/glutathione hydrolase
VRYRDAQFITNTPPSSGGILIAFALKLLEEAKLEDIGFGSSKHLKLLARAMEQTNNARRDVLNGNLYRDGVMEQFLGEENVAAFRRALRESVNKLGSTTHMSIIDGEGNLASATVTNGEGSGYVVPGTGIMMNNMLGEEDLNPEGFHKWKENVRISSMMSPSALIHGDRLYAIGSGGSNRIRSAILQTVLNIVDFNFPIEQAVNRGRIHFERGLLNIEKDYEDSVLEDLQKQFDDVKVWPEKNLFFGGCHAVAYDVQTKEYQGGGDLRRGGITVIA